MCGICGQVDANGVNEEQIAAMAAALAHRGPDDDGIYHNGIVGLGHRRLSIIDLAGGHQPMSNEDGTIWIIFNGEIYNYQELRSSLTQSHDLRTNSDTEVILHLYEEKGERCVEALRGMFSFAIWDDRRKSLLLARDPLGQKPLFYVHQGQRLAFASEIKALLAVDPSLRQMNSAALHQYLSLRIIAAPQTMFSQVHKLPPGHTLLYQDGQVHVRRYWHLHYEPKVEMDEDEWLDALEEQMLDTVRCHMVSDVPVGAFLSGGLDSGLVVAMMSKVADEPIHTFSMGLPYRETSELPYALLVADRYGTEHQEEMLDLSLIRVLPQLVWHLDEPSDPLSACTYAIAQMARRHVKVVLGGDGGDELFGGYDRYYGNQYVDLYARLPLALRKHLVQPILNALPDSFWYKSVSHQLKWLNQMSYSEGAERYAQSLGYFYFNEDTRHALYGERLREDVNGSDALAVIRGYYNADNAATPLDKMLYADSMVRLPDHPVMILDRMTMAHGVEARSPFMDHKLAEFVAQMPASLKIRGRTLRYMQKRLAARYLPPEVLQHKKQGFASALPYLLDGEFRTLFAAVLRDSRLVADGYLNRAPIQEMLDQHLQRRQRDHGNRLWLLCHAELWYQMKIQGRSQADMASWFGELHPVAEG